MVIIILAAVALCALLIGLVAVVGDKTPAVATTETTVEAAQAASGGWATIRTKTTPVWEAVRAQALTAISAEAIAFRALAKDKRQRRMAKRQRRWERRAANAEARAKALAEAKTRRLEARRAAKAEARAKSAAVAQRHGHAAARQTAKARQLEAAALASGQEAVKAHRRLVAAGLATPITLVAGIKAQKRAERGSTVAANARKREARMVAAQQRNAADRVAAAEGQSAFEAQREVRRTSLAAHAEWVDEHREELEYYPEVLWTAGKAKAELAEAKAADREARKAKLAEAKALANISWEQTQKARKVLKLERKALAKAELISWLEAGNGHASKTAGDHLAKLVEKAEEAAFDFWADTGVSPEVAADRAAIRAAREVVKTARHQVAA